MAGLWLMSHPNDPSKMVQTVFQPTRKKSAGVGSFWWKHLGGLLYDFLVICGCAIFIAVFCRVGSVWVGSFLFQWKHGLRLSEAGHARPRTKHLSATETVPHSKIGIGSSCFCLVKAAILVTTFLLNYFKGL